MPSKLIEHLALPVGDMTFDALAAGPADGEIVFLLHGFPQTARAWESQLVDLAEAGYRAVAPYQRGYSRGARPDSTSAYRLDCLVQDVMDMADVVGAGRFSVVGHDWGGAVAWALAAKHPRRIRRLVSVSTPHPAAMGESIFFSLQLLRSSYILLFRTPVIAEAVVGRTLELMLRRSGLTDDEKVQDYTRAMRDPGALTAALRWYRAAGPGNVRVGDIDEVPTLFVWGSADPALGRRAAKRTAAHVKAPYTFVPIDGAPHWIPEQRAEILNPLLLDHLRD